jgi:hypothetical protein
MGDTLRAVNYQRRVVDTELDESLAGESVVALEGAKGVGKGATAAERVDAEFRLESPNVRALVEADPDRLMDGRRVLLDEWQHLPFTWDLVRRAVDAGATPGQFLLTGSASPTDPGRHSGAGRILKLRLRPLTLSERGYEPSVSLADLLTGQRREITGDTSVDLAAYTREIVASGFPGSQSPSSASTRMHYSPATTTAQAPSATARRLQCGNGCCRLSGHRIRGQGSPRDQAGDLAGSRCSVTRSGSWPGSCCRPAHEVAHRPPTRLGAGCDGAGPVTDRESRAVVDGSDAPRPSCHFPGRRYRG